MLISVTYWLTGCTLNNTFVFADHLKYSFYLSQTLFRNPKKPVELSNTNTRTEVKLCLFLFNDDSKIVFPETAGLKIVSFG